MAQKYRGLPIPDSFWDELAAKEEAEAKKKAKENLLVSISSDEEPELKSEDDREPESTQFKNYR